MTSPTGTDPAPAPEWPGGEPDEPSPFGSSLPLARIAGISVRAHWSLLLAVGLFASLLAVSVLPAAAPGSSTPAYWIAASVTSLLFFVTLLAHELAHALAARHYGLPVRRITLWMLGGATELHDEPPTPRADAIVAGIGPAVSLGVGALLWGAVVVLAAAGADTGGLAVVSVAWLAGVNLLLGVFNLLPGTPLDGGRLLRAFLWWRGGDRRKAVAASSRAGRALGLAFVAVGLLEVLVGLYAGVWLALVGWFIATSAVGERMAESAEHLAGMRAGDVMRTHPVAVPDWWTVDQLLAGLDAAQTRQPAFPLVDLSGRVVGCLSTTDLEHLGPGAADTRLREATRPARLLLVHPQDDVAGLVRTLPLHRGLAIVTDEDGHPIGLITADDLARAARLADLGWHPDQHSNEGSDQSVR